MKTITTMSGLLMAVALLSNIEANAQTASNLVCSGCVNTGDIAANAVTLGKLHDSSVSKEKLGLSAKPAGAKFSTPVNVSTLPTTDTVVTSVTMDLPGPGNVILNSGGFALFLSNPAGYVCAITKGTATAGEPLVVGQNHNVANARRMPIATTRGFKETAGGPKTYNFVCQAQGTTSLFYALLTAVFAPQHY
jgi:hypothetical protein